MKTNASAKSIIKAVETVSASKYGNNVIFRKYPEKLTKHVLRFTLRTKDANKLGSLVSKDGHKQPKANWDVHEDVMKEIFALNPRNNIYVDTLYGRQFNDLPITESYVPETEEDEVEPVMKVSKVSDPAVFIRRGVETKVERVGGKFAPKNGAVVKRQYNKKNGEPNMSKLMKTLKYIIQHPELM